MRCPYCSKPARIVCLALSFFDSKAVADADPSLEEDTNILLNARNLATSGVSAFPIACALLSQKLENLLVTDIYLEEHLNPKMINKKYVNLENYKVNDYINIGDFKKSTHNLERLLSKDTNKILKIN